MRSLPRLQPLLACRSGGVPFLPVACAVPAAKIATKVRITSNTRRSFIPISLDIAALKSSPHWGPGRGRARGIGSENCVAFWANGAISARKFSASADGCHPRRAALPLECDRATVAPPNLSLHTNKQGAFSCRRDDNSCCHYLPRVRLLLWRTASCSRHLLRARSRSTRCRDIFIPRAKHHRNSHSTCSSRRRPLYRSPIRGISRSRRRASSLR